MNEFEKYEKMKDEYVETDEKYDFDLNIEIPDDDEDFQMQTPIRHKGQKDADFT